MANEQAPNIGADQATTAQPGNSLVANYEKVTGDK
jgi:hypothetical protein